MNRMIAVAIIVLAVAIGGYIWWSGQTADPEVAEDPAAPAAEEAASD